MENMRLTELKQIAKERKIKYYYRMRKEDLIRSLNASQPQNILDMPIPSNITQNTLTPTQYVPINYINTIKSKVSSFANWIIDYVPEPIKNVANEKLTSIKSLVSNFNKGSKIHIVLQCVMESTDIKNGETITAVVPFSSNSEFVLESTNLNDFYETVTNKILESMATFQRTKSNWRFVSFVKMEINIIEYKPIKEKNSERVDKDLKEQSEKLNWEKIKFPVSLQQITQFEKNNQDISVNVFGYEKLSVYPLHISKNKNRQHQIDLLLISNDDTNHYCLINNLSRLLSSQISEHNGKKHFCRNCLQSFSTEESLSKHRLYCDNVDSIRIEMPEPNTMLEFTNYNRSMKVAFVIYADFESFVKPIDTCTPNPDESYTKQYQKHTPSSFCYYIKCFDKSIEKTIKKTIGHNILSTFTADSEDDNVAQIFVYHLEADIKKIYNKYLKFRKDIIFTSKDKEEFNNAKICHICEEDLEEDKVKDHCHITGKYRGAAHNECNLNYKIPNFIPVFFHNLFIKNLSGNGESEEKINCIPNNEEKYISFSKQIKVDEYINKKGEKKEIKKELHFLDSFKFMASSLNELIKNSTKELDLYSDKKLNLLLRKGPKESFYSRLNDEGISDEDYLHAQTVWKEFNCETFRDYHNLYNVVDVLLLAHVFENFRNVCIKNYKLDPAWYYTSPGLAWDAALLITKVKLELLSDYDMILMIKKGIRGGISIVSNRLGTANNKYMENYDKNKESTYIQYLDANNLYGWAMKVDLEYPEYLHVHNDYPLAPERLKIDKVDKLVPNLNHKKNYIIHYENLKLYERLGMKLTKIHRGIKFEESAWLNLSKTLMYEFHYDYIKNKYRDRAKLLYTDTDSLIYETKTEDFYEDISNDIESKFDTSEFDPNHPAVKNGFKVGINKKVLAKFKDESAGKQISEFLGLRSKLYSYKIDEEDKKRCKGVKRNVVKNYITHEDYKDCLMNRKEQMRKMNVIRSHCHDVYTEEIKH
ncbi:uncharacterized protein LOC136072267 [Hydra vulgaris]|uniref:uncharacterized protein LOC136072267 n=1 Tax=Hydra vulgaris TaxID=6087 RepID=UPI0032EA1308